MFSEQTLYTFSILKLSSLRAIVNGQQKKKEEIWLSPMTKAPTMHPQKNPKSNVTT